MAKTTAGSAISQESKKHAWRILTVLFVGAFMALLDVTIVIALVYNVILIVIALLLVFTLPKHVAWRPIMATADI